MARQVTNHILMIRPVAFHVNEQTAVNNHYQQAADDAPLEKVQEQALAEFDELVEVLRSEGVQVSVFEDALEPATPDSIFPNNWISFHEDGTVRIYPMFAANRRLERREDIIQTLGKHHILKEHVDHSHWENKGIFLEGTGSLVLDRENKIAYAGLSERTMIDAAYAFGEEAGYQVVPFYACQTFDGDRLPIYHTNVMMSVGEGFALICLECVDNDTERERLLLHLEQTGKEVIAISEEQVAQFAGNMLQVLGANDRRLIVMSSSAFHSLLPDQKNALEKHGKLVHSDIPTIERLGGGSVRCMMAEVFLKEIDELHART